MSVKGRASGAREWSGRRIKFRSENSHHGISESLCDNIIKCKAAAACQTGSVLLAWGGGWVSRNGGVGPAMAQLFQVCASLSAVSEGNRDSWPGTETPGQELSR